MLWILLIVVFGVTADEISKVVEIEQGPVRGYKVPGSNVFAFYNIPYATAPVGPNRFKAPEAPPTWSEPYEAKDQHLMCPQHTPAINSHENCLIANVFIPDSNNTDLPVMLLFHSGAFQVGFGNMGTALGLMNNTEMITVNFNYRLGVHGFLCLGTEDAPGNAGMKDQLAFLRWVKKNIQAFGGNPNDITITGCSAGGVAVDLVRLVNVTDGLFNKVITESGANAGSFGVQIDPIQNAKFHAKALGFDDVNDISAMGNFYKTASIETLFSRSDLSHAMPNSTITFGPCIEKEIEGIEGFLYEAPVNILKRGSYKRLPMLYGFADMEGLIRVPFLDDWKTDMNENFFNYLPGDLAFESAEEKEAVAKRVKEFYFKDQAISEETVMAYIDFFSDTLFIQSMLRSVKLNAESGNNSTIFLYEYSFVDENTSVHVGNVSGANHCSQIMAVLDEDESSLTEEYIDMKTVMRKLYSDFVTTGNPTSEESTLPAWTPANADRDPHMALGLTISLEGPMLQARTQLWDEIYEKHYRGPIPPTSNAFIIRPHWIVYSFIFIVLKFR